MTTPLRRIRLPLLIAVAGLTVLTACTSQPEATEPGETTTSPSAEAMGGMGGGMGAMDEDAPRFPPVAGFYDGSEILFIHSETSDAEIADLLTSMMGDSPVVVVEALAEVPERLLADVYVFTNGIQPDSGAMGPLGFQPDVFDSAPGDAAYSPLRRIVLVEWTADANPRLLTSVGDVDEALNSGEVTVERTGKVVVMPFLEWPGGRR